jgi:Family of unknown function (DUF5372)
MRDEDGRLFSLPAGWTDAAAEDAFVVIAAGRCPFTLNGLLAVADVIDGLRAGGDANPGCQDDYTVTVKRITPQTTSMTNGWLTGSSA